MLARAMQAKPDVLLADEPTADLEDHTAEQVISGLMALANRGCTLVIASHDPRLTKRMGREIPVGQRA